MQFDGSQCSVDSCERQNSRSGILIKADFPEITTDGLGPLIDFLVELLAQERMLEIESAAREVDCDVNIGGVRS